jgi:hypothetical protein
VYRHIFLFEGKTCLQQPLVVQAKRSGGLEKATTRYEIYILASVLFYSEKPTRADQLVGRTTALVIVLYSSRVLSRHPSDTCCFIETQRPRGAQVSRQPKKRAPLTRGTVSPPLPVPANIPRPPYVGTKGAPEIAKEIQMHDKESIVHMRAACELAARVLEYAGTLVKVSMPVTNFESCLVILKALCNKL